MDTITEAELGYFKQLDERQKRIFAGLKASQMGRSGVRLVSEQLGIDIKTVRKGLQEFKDLPETPSKRIRKEGGGTKKN